MKKLIPFASLPILAACTSQPETKKPETPNIIIVYADDLGYGDVGCYGADSKYIKTPNIDRMAEMGVRFTDAHCTSGMSTPSRFSLLTGKYAFRNQAHILPGDAPLIIRPGTPTLPEKLKQAGYETAVVGKWHLGLGDGIIDWNDSIKPGPLEIGFDYSYLIPATGDRVPCVYVENHHVVNLDSDDPVYVSYDEPIGDWPTGESHPELLRYEADPQHSNTIINGISRIGWMHGGKEALWTDEEFPDLLTDVAKDFIQQNMDKPFFLFYALHDPHVPRLPNPRFEGQSALGLRGDAIVQIDWIVGEILDYVEELGIAENTLVIFTSDNGPVLDDGYEDLALELNKDHTPAGPFNGSKYSAFEGATRMPTIVVWPPVIEPETVNNATISQADFFASFAALIGLELENHEAPDSKNLIDVLLGKSDQGRADMILQASNTLSLRKGDWKYIRPNPDAEKAIQLYSHKKSVDLGLSTEPQLYNLAEDIGETNNLAVEHPELVAELEALLEKQISEGSTRAGFVQP
jgi:arylsulfatase A